MKIAICDDNKEELLYISSVLYDYIQERNALVSYKAFHSATELLSSAPNGGYDLYLLDVVMPEIDGIELAKEIRSFDKNAQIAFLTSSPEFAMESYAVKACNYLLKPVTKEKLFCALDDIMENTSSEKQRSIVVKSSNGIQKLLLSQLIYVEALERRVIYHMTLGKVVECLSGFSEVCEELLKYPQFIKTHRSYLVNMSYICTIKNADIILQTRDLIPIAQRRIAEVKERYLAFQMEEN